MSRHGLALVSVLQFVEGLTDRQAAYAVQSRLDWKYALSLELMETGFRWTSTSAAVMPVLEDHANGQWFAVTATGRPGSTCPPARGWHARGETTDAISPVGKDSKPKFVDVLAVSHHTAVIGRLFVPRP